LFDVLAQGSGQCAHGLPDNLDRLIANQGVLLINSAVSDLRGSVTLLAVCVETDFYFVSSPPEQQQCIVDSDAC
jgi:hypothetical protein